MRKHEHGLSKVRGALRTIKGKRLAVLGLAFKDGTDDVRESPAIKVIEQLLEEKYQITAFDPAAMAVRERFWMEESAMLPIPYAAADGADALLILTEWKEFANLDLVRIKDFCDLRCAGWTKCVLTSRNAEAGLTYHSIGSSDAGGIP